MSIAVAKDIATATIEGENLKLTGKSMELRVVNRTQSGKVISDTNEKQCATKKSAMFTVSAPSQGASCQVGALDVSALTIDGVDRLVETISLGLDVRNEFIPAEGISDEWEAIVFTGQSITGKATLNVPLTIARGLITDAFSSTLSNLNVTFAFTLNSVAVSVPLMISELSWGAVMGAEQLVNVTLAERGAVTSPAGTTSILEKVLNAPGTSQTLALQTKSSTGGVTFGGEFHPETYSLSIERGGLISEDYTYRSSGAVTEAASS